MGSVWPLVMPSGHCVSLSLNSILNCTVISYTPMPVRWPLLNSSSSPRERAGGSSTCLWPSLGSPTQSVLPCFLGSGRHKPPLPRRERGVGHSVKKNRQEGLKLCVWPSLGGTVCHAASSLLSRSFMPDSWQPRGLWPARLHDGILQARILEWVAIYFSRGSSQPRDRTQVSCTAGRFLTD